MTIAELLSDLRAKGIRVWWDGKKLRYRAPEGALTPDVRSLLTERKTEVIAFLETYAPPVIVKPVAISPAPRGSASPLSFAEEGLWLHEKLTPGTAAWNMQSTMRVRGSLDVAALERSLNALVRRQEVLRTAFTLNDGGPVRVITPELSLKLPIIDLSRSAEPNKAIDQMASAEEKSPFDLSKAPLFRIKLLRLSETEHILLLTKHHIITDAWSAMLFFKELFALYYAPVTGVSPALPDLPIQYSDYAFWLRHLETSEMEPHLAYWKRQLAGMQRVELPRDRPKNADRSFRGSTERLQLSPLLSRALRELCKRERVTPFMTLLAAFMVLVYRDTGETDIVVGSTVAGRNKPELEPLIGLFVNVVVLRSNLAGEPTFREALARVREICLQAHQHQDCPFEKLVQELGPARDPSRNGLFQVLFNVVNLPSIPHTVNGLALERLARHRDTARFDLTLYAPETAEGFDIIAAYNRDLFSAERIHEMLEQYKLLLGQVVENPDRKIDRYSLVTPNARKFLPDPAARLDHSWYGAAHEMFALCAERQPNQCAVQDSRTAWSYKELNERSNRLAHYLVAHGIGREDIAAIYGHRSATLVWALLGVLKAGAAFCVIDPAHPPARVEEYLAATDPKALIEIGGAGGPSAEMAQVLSRSSLRCKITLAGAAISDALLAQYPQYNPAIELSPDDLAYVIFTSGSTGKPKGVMGRHGPLTHFLPWVKETFGLSENDRFSFLSGLGTNKLQREVFTALGLGGTFCIPDPQDIGALGKLDAWLRKEAVSVVHLTPAMAQLLEETATGSIPSVRRAFFGGDLLRLQDVDRVRRLMPNAEIANFYNSSETQRGGSYFVFSEQVLKEVKEIPPLGRGVKDVQLLVLNRDRELAGIGELGEIIIRSPHMARGYLGDDELTKKKFIINPFTGLDGDRVYRTGELGRFLPDGGVEFVSRQEDQVSIRGFRVDLREIEAVLAQHPAVREAVVAAPAGKNGESRLVSYVVLRHKPGPTANELRGYLQQRLPDYMVPVAFVNLDAIPLTTTGKADRRALPAPGDAAFGLHGTFFPPRTRLEAHIAEAWKEVLGVERIGVYDNFFDLGGHSLLSVQAVALLEKKTGLKMHPKSFVAQTLGQLAAAYEERMRLHEQPGPVSFTRRCWSTIKSALFQKRNTDR